ncbi:TfoX/Sxy family protein [Microbacterium telephonicum]|uniref:TfoX-like protein n=1 Tax=Microbacterium telephonicum TaxID=1714841 RepID=A0A498CA24_9MICO|nr:TfoX/Sxy family protein [Microbacterium telephonicum]RLK49710.1 TfoX-like protein [Microbacterium telephonicum]
MPLSEAQGELTDRVRALLADEPDLEEKAMFGSRAFLLDEKIVVAVFRDASLLVRVHVEEAASLVLEPGASPAVMGPQRREMGPGWLLVDHDHLDDDTRLLFWLDAARDFRRGQG